MSDKLEIRYVPVNQVERWNKNPKLHDLDALRVSIEMHGFKDPPKFEPALNGGGGGIVEGNGRVEVLTLMEESGASPPRGVAVDENGQWCMPVIFGVDAKSRAEAEAYGLDHNNLTMLGGNLRLEDLLSVWDEEGLRELHEGGPDIDEFLTSFDGEPLEVLLGGPDFSPVEADEQPKLGEKAMIVCPECQHEFLR